MCSRHILNDPGALFATALVLCSIQGAKFLGWRSAPFFFGVPYATKLLQVLWRQGGNACPTKLNFGVPDWHCHVTKLLSRKNAQVTLTSDCIASVRAEENRAVTQSS
eukprot:4653345-Amphidinium_carterae.1